MAPESPESPTGAPHAALTAPFRLQYAYKRSLGPVIGAFMSALREGRILGASTDDGRVIVPAREYDPATGRSTVELVEVGPAGVIETLTHMADRSAWALVRLDGADTSWLHRLDACGQTVSAGSRVKPRWRTERVGQVSDIEAFVPESVESDELVPVESSEPVTRFKAPTDLAYEVTANKVTAEFLRSILEQKLMGRRCPACSKVYVPPRSVCPTCSVRTFDTVEVGQSGVIQTFSVVRIPFHGQVLEPPYVCARILLDGVDVTLLHIVGDIDPDLVTVGMRVTAVWDPEPMPTLARVRYFRPDGAVGEERG